jgi:hypothetical protein
MKGTIVWKWCDNEGKVHRFRIPNSYYVPDGKVRLLSPQHWAKTQARSSIQRNKGFGETTTARKTILFWNDRKHQLDVYLDKEHNVATFYMAPGYKKFALFCQKAEINYAESCEHPITVHESTLVSDDDDDLPPSVRPRRSNLWSRLNGLPNGPKKRSEAPTENHSPQKTIFNLDGPTNTDEPKPAIIEEEEDKQPTTDAAELLRIHQRFGHISMAKLRNMAQQNIIPRRLAKCSIPVCTACQFAKATRRRWRDKTKSNWNDAKKPTQPGQVVSVDQLVSPTPGLIAQLTGRATKKRYNYATVYVDQYSGLSFVYLQKTANADETIEGKKAFEAYSKQHGVEIKAYHADNGIFRANKWVDNCRNSGQTLTFAGVNAHHSNGHAERRIRSLQDLTRTMLIHANRRWPTAVTVHLWPYALRMANNAINEAPNLKDKEGRSPLQIFSRTDINLNVKHWKPFGCPVYVLDSALQSGRGIHGKWKIRSKIGIYLGRSPNHSRNVALILDRVTGLVSPQFHISFDPSFDTVKKDNFDILWQQKVGLMLEDFEKKGPPSKIAKSVTGNSRVPKRGAPPPEGDEPTDGNISRTKRTRFDPSIQDTPNKVRDIPQTTTSYDSQSDENKNTQSPDTDMGHSRRNRNGNNPSDSSPSSSNKQQQPEPAEVIAKAMMTELSTVTADNVEGEIFCYRAMFPAYAGQEEEHPLMAYKTTSDPDTMYHHQAMKEPDRDEFRKAMQKEWTDQLENGNFSVIHRTEVPEGATVLPAVWQMKRKRDILTRKIKKYKARLNIDGSRMKQGQHYDQTYAPVASWNSIRTLLIMSALNNWHTRQIDYVLAYPQAPVERQIFMEIPKGFQVEGENSKDYVLELHRNVYGQKQAGRVWYKYLSNILIHKVGFKQSKVDECVFYRGKVMYVL